MSAGPASAWASLGEGCDLLPLSSALEIAKAAYEEALIRHGMLPAAIAVVHAYAEQNLEALEAEEDP
ncbi:hypothetical protein [Actinomadura macrotermitis]|uniref:Uncharacterized protein n=1 Tax=Actinomadura macrotermitis TaxID=2585200 RepID=A0A7K0C1D5_9ACTN|nr:hypothetical protein [Actinomadura macrotermitis]MQY07283.1 hypothetical protein [Actinomadura macrotermitis]